MQAMSLQVLICISLELHGHLGVGAVAMILSDHVCQRQHCFVSMNAFVCRGSHAKSPLYQKLRHKSSALLFKFAAVPIRCFVFAKSF